LLVLLLLESRRAMLLAAGRCRGLRPIARCCTCSELPRLRCRRRCRRRLWPEIRLTKLSMLTHSTCPTRCCCLPVQHDRIQKHLVWMVSDMAFAEIRLIKILA
jgi:hypothetical protein